MKTRKTVAGTAANPTVRAAKIELNGQQYELAFDFNAIAVAEAATGLNLLQKLDFVGVNAQQFRALFYAGLLKRHPEITLAEAGNLIDLSTLGKITDALLEAWTGALPERKEDGNPPSPEPEPAAE